MPRFSTRLLLSVDNRKGGVPCYCELEAPQMISTDNVGRSDLYLWVVVKNPSPLGFP